MVLCSSLEKAMAPHSSTLAWKIHGWRRLVGCSPWGRQESDTTERLHFHFSLFTFHFHALEKEMATHSSVLVWRIPGMGEAWWAAVYGVTQSQTRLKRLSSSSSMLFPGRVLPIYYYFPISIITFCIALTYSLYKTFVYRSFPHKKRQRITLSTHFSCDII